MSFVRRRVITECKGGRTKQSHKDSCDINIMLRRYETKGLLPRFNATPGRSGDFTAAQDYQSSLDKVLTARQQFNSLPARVRSYFGHDPVKFLEFMNDPKNLDKAVELGLAVKRPTSTPAVSPPVAPPPAPPAK